MEALQWGADVQSGDTPFSLARKRSAEEELENDQRLAKRFNLLNLGIILLRSLLTKMLYGQLLTSSHLRRAEW